MAVEKTESKTRSFCPEKEECEEIELKHKAEDSEQSAELASANGS